MKYSWVFLLLSLSAYGQECATDDFPQWPIQHYSAPRTTDILVIPVVFHLVHRAVDGYGSVTNITDDQLISAVTEFNHLMVANPYGDTGIRLCLANVNPTGGTTTGIIRYTGNAEYEAFGVRAQTANGVLDSYLKTIIAPAWPKQHYYNIWVVSEIDDNNGGWGVQGYAMYPTPSLMDGTVILFNAIGVIGNLKFYTNQNKTLVHEIGHALNLPHTFAGTTSCTSETNCATQGDYCCDTPPHNLTNACPSITCNPAPVYNIMSYSPQDCRTEFTPCQIQRMRAALISSPYRNTLPISNRCAVVNNCEGDMCANAIDLSLCEITSYSNAICASDFQVEGMNPNVGFCPDTSTPLTIPCPAGYAHYKNIWFSFDWPGGIFTMDLFNTTGFTSPYVGQGWTLWEKGATCQQSRVVWGSSCSIAALCNPAIVTNAYGLVPWSPYFISYSVSGNLPAGEYYLEIWSKGISHAQSNSGSGMVMICQPIVLNSPPMLLSEGLRLIWNTISNFTIIQRAENDWIDVATVQGNEFEVTENGIYRVVVNGAASNYVRVNVVKSGQSVIYGIDGKENARFGIAR
jgi:hypothetical protein